MLRSICLKRRVLFSVRGAPAPAPDAQPFSHTSILLVRAFHSLNLPLREQFSISFGSEIDKLLEPRKPRAQGGTTQSGRSKEKRSRKKTSAKDSLTTLLDDHATQLASRLKPKNTLPENVVTKDIARATTKPDRSRESLPQVEQQFQDNDGSAIELSIDAYDAISQPRTLGKSFAAFPGSKAQVKRGGTSTTQANISQAIRTEHRPKPAAKAVIGGITPERPAPSKLEPWAVQKNALTSKFGDDGWSPRKKLSPDAIEGIRSLHEEDPERYTTPFLSEHFKVSPEAIRRILKSKWRATPEKMEERRARWARRHDRIWDQKAALGLRPPRTTDKQPEGPEVFEEEVRAKQLLGQL